MRKPSPKKINVEKRKFKKAIIDEKKEFNQVRSSIEKVEKHLRSLFRPMKELGKKRR